jgi:hypothetical protein
MGAKFAVEEHLFDIEDETFQDAGKVGLWTKVDSVMSFLVNGWSIGIVYLLIVATNFLIASPAAAFPPYRSTDADTADPYTLELRVGLVKLDHDCGDMEVATPLLRANFGLPRKVELITEFEYVAERGEFGDGAAGGKWVPMFGGTASFGIETLALLPLRPGDQGVGVESQLLVTFWSDDVHVHVNGGGFHDARVSPAEDGWRASVLAEFPREGYRPGVELFAKRIEDEPTDVRAGVGVIFDLATFDVRTGLHAGLTDEAPDISFILWITTKLPLR